MILKIEIRIQTGHNWKKALTRFITFVLLYSIWIGGNIHGSNAPVWSRKPKTHSAVKRCDAEKLPEHSDFFNALPIVFFIASVYNYVSKGKSFHSWPSAED